ncbi:hypothetical protein SLS60_005090 [Paraconiothyrium brasiliense]|uniref:Uncharacterized protein n=1 Tax=Paraconiothyrium brasiliense TaxID=300254 RepID=A0ABR3RGD5_9PLEO
MPVGSSSSLNKYAKYLTVAGHQIFKNAFWDTLFDSPVPVPLTEDFLGMFFEKENDLQDLMIDPMRTTGLQNKFNEELLGGFGQMLHPNAQIFKVS